MKRALALFVVLVCAMRGFGAGLIIVGDEAFWRGSPPIIIPPEPSPWPEPRPHPVPPPRRMPPPRPVFAPLELSFTKADVKIKDQVAATKVEQEFYNPNPTRLEGTFLFPVPRGAHIDRFSMLINGKPAEAELLSADKARGIYEDIVRRQRDPALLEYAGRDLFKVRIFPIEPNEHKKVTLSYTQVLKADSGLVTYVLPLDTSRFSGKSTRNVSAKVEIATRQELKSVYSPSHKVEVKRDGLRKATIGFESRDDSADADFQLIYSQDESDLGVNLMTFEAPGEDGYFLLLASPGDDSKKETVMAKDVVFVLDTSGSMAGPKLEQAKKALAFCIENLNDEDQFEVLRFSTEVEPAFDKLSSASRENRGRAQKFVSSLRPIGGTAINDALARALALRPAAGMRPFVVVFLTDGLPTVGITDQDHIVANVIAGRNGVTRIFCFGIGNDVNTHLLDKIAEETKAASQYVLPEEDIEVKVSSFFSKIKGPVLANPKITFPDGVRVTKMYPSPLPDVFKGEQVVVLGRYSGNGHHGAIQIEGGVNGELKKFACDVKFAAGEANNDFIPRLWATRRVGYLLDEIRLHGESRELKDEVTELARKYGIVTPYTAFLINEDETRRNVPLSMQSLPGMREREVAAATSSRFYRMKMESSGGAAVSDARSISELKQAQAPRAAIVANNYEMLRSMAPQEQSSFGRLADKAVAVTGPAPAQQAAQAIEQQSRFVNGRNFFLNKGQWVDALVQNQANVPRVQLQFGSSDYFKFASTNAAARPWLALGRQVQFVSGNTVYEIVE